MKDLSPETRQLLDVARDGDSPSASDRARVRRALTASLATGAATSASAAAKAALGGAFGAGASAGAAKSVAAWVAIGAAAGLATSAAIFTGVSTWRSHAAAPAASHPAVARTNPTSAIAASSPGAAASRDRESAANAGSAPPRAPESATPLVAPPPPSATALAAPGTPQKTKHTAAGNAANPAPHGGAATETAGTSLAGSMTAVPPSVATAPTSLRAETALLENASAALGRGDATGALALLDEHEREFPHGALVEERRATRVFALCSLGRRAEAQSEAERLLRQAPSSPLRARVLQSCGAPR